MDESGPDCNDGEARSVHPAGGRRLSEEIAGATAGRAADGGARCVYPPSEGAVRLIVEHFGFLPITFIDEIINAANDTVYRATDALSKFVEKEQGSGEATLQAVNKAETLLEHAVDKNFDKFELYALRNLFNVPRGAEDFVVMAHRRGDVGGHVTAEDEADVDGELAAVRRQVAAGNVLRSRLQRDVARVERGVRRLRAVNERLHVTAIARRALAGDSAAAAAGDMRRQAAEVTRLAEQLAAVSDGGSLAALNDPAGRDVYLARIADMQIASWESRQARQQPGTN
ncbi:hypothetical protein GGI04_004531 [Coemansia thaxteri]|nr:hypothetical protein GGI04_004531 [Coemansia thaxteri]